MYAVYVLIHTYCLRTLLVNYKQYRSVQMQAVCDAKGRFLTTFVVHPGSEPDTQVFKTVHYAQGYFLPGDGGYPCLEIPVTVIIHYWAPLGRLQQQSSSCHTSACTVIECAIGMMKAEVSAPVVLPVQLMDHDYDQHH